MSTTIPRKSTAKARIDQIIGRALNLAGRHVRTRRALERLLYLVRTRTDFLRPTNARDRYADLGTVNVVSGLLALAGHHRDWLRPASDWMPSGEGALPRFASLAQHLLSHYPLPIFMASVWFRGSDDQKRQEGWYKHLGLGRNIRTADIPLPLTSRMAHEFAMAPDHYSVDMALRWGQVRGLGGSKELARWIVATRLGRSFEHEDFWRTVVHFFVNHPELGLEHIGPIVDYLYNQRFIAEPGEFADGPPQPNLSMKGRTPRSLLRQVGEWHARLTGMKRYEEFRWGRSGIGEFRLPVDAEEQRCWTIRELLSSSELYCEGAAMRHCVGTYSWTCRYGNTSIWSMQFGSDGRRYRALTIEVDQKARTIRQARRCANAPPTTRLRGIMEQWARQEGLTIEC
jgi:PcfJ-like protein